MRRIRQIALEALRPEPGQRLLDAGCGLGHAAREMAAYVVPDGEVVALDVSAPLVELAARRENGVPVSYRVGNVSALDYPDESFDAVRCERVLQHVADPDGAIAELIRVTRRAGTVCLIDTDWESLALDAALTIWVVSGRR